LFWDAAWVVEDPSEAFDLGNTETIIDLNNNEMLIKVKRD